MSIAKHVPGVVHVMDDMHVSLPMGPAKRACAVVVVKPHCPIVRTFGTRGMTNS